MSLGQNDEDTKIKVPSITKRSFELFTNDLNFDLITVFNSETHVRTSCKNKDPTFSTTYTIHKNVRQSTVKILGPYTCIFTDFSF